MARRSAGDTRAARRLFPANSSSTFLAARRRGSANSIFDFDENRRPWVIQSCRQLLACVPHKAQRRVPVCEVRLGAFCCEEADVREPTVSVSSAHFLYNRRPRLYGRPGAVGTDKPDERSMRSPEHYVRFPPSADIQRGMSAYDPLRTLPRWRMTPE